MPVADVLRLGLEVLSALRAAHAEGVLHRDVKPANVLLRPDGSAVLTGFGIAALHGSTDLSATGDLIGSPEYIAPERVRGQENNPASDLWSLGMLLYVAAEGVHPLRRATQLATVVAVLDEPIPAPTRSGPLGPVLERLLVRDPAARPDAARLEQLLREASAALVTDRPAAAPLRSFGPALMIPTEVQAPTPPAGPRPGAPTVPVRGPAAGGGGRRLSRRTGLIALAVATLLAGGTVAAVQWPDGPGTPAAQGPGQQIPRTTPAPSRPTPTGSATPSGGPPGSGASGPAAVPRGSLISPAGARAAVAALRAATGTTTFFNLRIYEGYVLADVPVTPGAKTTKRLRPRGHRRQGREGVRELSPHICGLRVVDHTAGRGRPVPIGHRSAPEGERGRHRRSDAGRLR